MNNYRRIIGDRLREKEGKKRAQKQLTILFLISSTLIFSTLLIVWLKVLNTSERIPDIYLYNTVVILFSSFSIIMAKRSLKINEFQDAFKLLVLTILLGLLFGVSQIFGWGSLLDRASENGMLLPFSIIHFLHILVGLSLLLVVIIRINKLKVHSKAMAFSNNIFYFWHFLGVIWVSFLYIIM